MINLLHIYVLTIKNKWFLILWLTVHIFKLNEDFISIQMKKYILEKKKIIQFTNFQTQILKKKTCVF
jgi:hypothetical protein